jgi:hypothetical protein
MPPKLHASAGQNSRRPAHSDRQIDKSNLMEGGGEVKRADKNCISLFSDPAQRVKMPARSYE